jgi:hypothetical protein
MEKEFKEIILTSKKFGEIKFKREDIIKYLFNQNSYKDECDTILLEIKKDADYEIETTKNIRRKNVFYILKKYSDIEKFELIFDNEFDLVYNPIWYKNNKYRNEFMNVENLKDGTLLIKILKESVNQFINYVPIKDKTSQYLNL